MMQTGDPTGTGKGGESIWGGKFKDDFDSRLEHDRRGVVSMANSGKNTNGSQFFITYKSAPNLNLKHAIFGRVVGGLATLDLIEAVETDPKDVPREEVIIRKATVFQSPIAEMEDALERELLAKIEARETEAVPAKPAARAKPMPVDDRVGKYLPTASQGPAESASPPPPSSIISETAAMSGSAPKKAKKSGGGGFGNFSSW
jgi:peptidyl-prolyl cis-trans isomerase-like protein 2